MTETKQLVFFRKSRFEQGECEMYSESLVRSAMSAWVKNVDRTMSRLKKGDKVFTPYAVYFTMTVEEWKGRKEIIISLNDDIINE